MDNIIAAKRLKELRESKHLSHKSLSKQLQKECGVSISDKQLMYYESAAKDDGHIKANTVCGMAAQTLCAIAEFYSVSTDYLLGLADVPTTNQDKRFICEYTGLSETMVDQLHLNAKVSSMTNKLFCVGQDIQIRNLLNAVADLQIK